MVVTTDFKKQEQPFYVMANDYNTREKRLAIVEWLTANGAKWPGESAPIALEGGRNSSFLVEFIEGSHKTYYLHVGLRGENRLTVGSFPAFGTILHGIPCLKVNMAKPLSTNAIFIMFLKKHRAFSAFKRNFDQDFHDDNSDDDVSMEINASFEWDSSPEGDDYWGMLHTKWSKMCDDLKLGER